MWRWPNSEPLVIDYTNTDVNEMHQQNAPTEVPVLHGRMKDDNRTKEGKKKVTLPQPLHRGRKRDRAPIIVPMALLSAEWAARDQQTRT